MSDPTTSDNGTVPFDPTAVDLTTADPRDVICFLTEGGNDYDGRLGARISAVFVVLIVSTAATMFPVLATRVRRLRIPLYVYLFARYFGSGVIVATAFIHLLDPAYEEIGPASCVGMTGGWAEYTWPPALAMASAMIIFLFDFLADCYVEGKYGVVAADDARHAMVEGALTTSAAHGDAVVAKTGSDTPPSRTDVEAAEKSGYDEYVVSDADSTLAERGFHQQIAAFLTLEFGVIFHSVIIGLNLGVVGDEFNTLYPVIVFHQGFEGLGIGARLSAIPFPRRFAWMPWALCAAYGLTTPISIAIGIGLSTQYNSGSFTASVVSGVFDSISAGILIYTGFVELLARDFIFNENRTRDRVRVTFMLVCVFLGAGIMALLGKWA